MKKFTSFTAMLLLVLGSVFTLSSCDAIIADSLEGTWEGNMYISSSYNGHKYNSTYTEIEFLKDPFRFTKGSGYWVDYYSDAPWDYVANHFTWRVDDRVITINFLEDGSTLYIRNYSLTNDHFTGEVLDGDNYVTFSLVHTSSPNWEEDYDNWGYDDWGYDDYYYSKGTRSTNDSTTTKIERPHRFVRAK